MLWALTCPAVDSATDALVLVALAEHVGSDVDAVAWPSSSRLARYARCDERTVRRSLDRLRDAGVIEPGPPAPGRLTSGPTGGPTCGGCSCLHSLWTTPATGGL